MRLAPLIVFVSSAATVATACGSPWDAYMKQPTDASFATLQKSVGSTTQQCDWGKEINSQAMPLDKREPLFALIAAGNESAFRAGLMALRCFDGADLEGFYRASGSFFEAHPRLFLEISSKGQTADRDMKSALTALPSNTIDDVKRKLVVLDRRIALLKELDESDLSTTRGLALSYLQQERQELEKVGH